MTRGPGAAVDGDTKGSLHRHPDGADSARPQNGMQLRCKYGLLASEEPAVDPATEGTQVIGDIHRATRGTCDQGQTVTVTVTGDRTGRRALLARGMPEDENGERRPPEWHRALNECGH